MFLQLIEPQFSGVYRCCPHGQTSPLSTELSAGVYMYVDGKDVHTKPMVITKLSLRQRGERWYLQRKIELAGSGVHFNTEGEVATGGKDVARGFKVKFKFSGRSFMFLQVQFDVLKNTDCFSIVCSQSKFPYFKIGQPPGTKSR